MNAATQAAHEARVNKVEELTAAILAASFFNDEEHNDVLTALLNAYICMATAHTCCTKGCAAGAAQAAFILSQHAASIAPQGAPIH